MTEETQDGLVSAEQAIVEELEVARIKKQIKRLKQLPKDFRDMEVMSKDWTDFAEIMGPEKKNEMLLWAKGGVLCLAPTNELERKVLTVYGELHEFHVGHPDDLEDALAEALELNASFIYASEWPKHVVTGMNWLASHYSWNYRFKGQLMGGKGHPLGI